MKRIEQKNRKRNRDKRLITDFTNRWLCLRARFKVEDLFIALQMIKVLLHRLFVVTLHASDLLCKTSFLRFIHASSNSSQQHGKNASQILRKGQKLQAAHSNPCIKSYPPSFKKPSFYSFHAHMRKPNFPQEFGLFLGSNPPPNDQDILKKPLSGPKNKQKNNSLKLKTHFYIKIHSIAPLGWARALFTWSYALHMSKHQTFGLCIGFE